MTETANAGTVANTKTSVWVRPVDEPNIPTDAGGSVERFQLLRQAKAVLDQHHG